jgi:hypothetical protein
MSSHAVHVAQVLCRLQFCTCEVCACMSDLMLHNFSFMRITLHEVSRSVSLQCWVFWHAAVGRVLWGRHVGGAGVEKHAPRISNHQCHSGFSRDGRRNGIMGPHRLFLLCPSLFIRWAFYVAAPNTLCFGIYCCRLLGSCFIQGLACVVRWPLST